MDDSRLFADRPTARFSNCSAICIAERVFVPSCNMVATKSEMPACLAASPSVPILIMRSTTTNEKGMVLLNQHRQPIRELSLDGNRGLKMKRYLEKRGLLLLEMPHRESDRRPPRMRSKRPLRSWSPVFVPEQDSAPESTHRQHQKAVDSFHGDFSS